MKEIIQTYKTYWLLMPPNKYYLAIIFISKIFGTICSVLIPYTASGIIKYITLGDYRAAQTWIFYFFFATTAHVISYYFNYYGGALDSNYCYTGLKKKIFCKLATYDMEFSKTREIDEILQATSSDVWGVVALNDNLSDVIITFFKVIIVIILTTCISLPIGLIVTFFCFLYFVLTVFFNKKIAYYLHKQRKYQDKIAGVFIEEMESTEELKVYAMQEKYQNYFDKININFCNNYRKKRRFSDIQENFLKLILELGEVVIYLTTLFLLLKGSYTVDKIVLVIGYFGTLILSLNYMLVTCVQNMITKSISVERIANIFKYKPKDNITLGDNQTDDIKGILEFKHVYSSYLNEQVLKDVSFKIRPHELTAIVGRSGSGKSTILNNILRLYIPDSGTILIDEKNIYDYEESVYKTNVSVVTQKSFLFDMSIRENLSLVEKNKEYQEEVCKKLGIHDEILSLPNGYLTKLEESGSNVSTRLKQLLSVARSILTKSEILLLDEVTSSLDEKTTKHIIKVFKELTKDHTVILITHKKELMQQVDHLIIIDRGRKVADGSPKALENNKYYLRLKNSKSFEKEGDELPLTANEKAYNDVGSV